MLSARFDVYTLLEYSLLTTAEPGRGGTEKSLAQFRQWPFWLRDNSPRPLGTFYFRNWDHRRGITFLVAEVGELCD